LTSKDLQVQIEGAIRTYNRYRSPEVIAELVSIEKDSRKFTVLFKGTFCRTCGFYDYFEDLIYDVLDEVKIQTKVLDVDEAWETEDFKVTYVVEESNLRSRSKVKKGEGLKLRTKRS
jgi:hypothetical protein